MPEVDYDAEYAKRIKLNQARMEQEILSGSKEIVNKIKSRLGMYGLKTTVADVLKELQGKINDSVMYSVSLHSFDLAPYMLISSY